MYRTFCRLSPTILGLCTVLAVVFIGACEPEKYKVEADKEVYDIIDAKWDDRYGGKANYAIADSAASQDELRADGSAPQSKVMSLAEAVAIATSNSRDYQRQKEQLYLSALDLTLARHQFAHRAH